MIRDYMLSSESNQYIESINDWNNNVDWMSNIQPYQQDLINIFENCMDWVIIMMYV
jgi:hypothetical protein